MIQNAFFSCHSARAGLVLVSWFALSQSLEAQIKPQEGEPIKVHFLNSWYDGVVIERKGEQYGIQYEFASRVKQGMFKRAEIRLMCEVNAIDLARSWTSNSGQFKVDAALLRIEDDSVHLMKTDQNEIEVPIAKLSEKDVAYLEKFKKAMDMAVSRGAVPAQTPKLPEIESFSGSSSSSPVVGYGEGKMVPMGSIPPYLAEFQQAGTGFNFLRKNQELVAVVPVGGPEQLALMTTYEDDFFTDGVLFPSQLYWVSLKQKKVVGTVYITPKDYAVDYDPKSKILVSALESAHTGRDKSYVVTSWRLNPGATKIEPVVRWETPLAGTDSLYVKVINDRIVVGKSGKNTYVAWDTVDKKELYAIGTRSFFDVPAVLTLDRKHLILPEDG